MLHEVLHVPDLSCNLVSVSKASEKGKVTEFNESGCQLKKSDGTVIALAVRCGSLCFLDCQSLERANVAGLNEDFGMVIWAISEGKHHRNPFPTGGGMRAEHILDLVHTDVCGKFNPRSEGDAEYFVTFIDKSQLCGSMYRNP